jgi:glutathione S-transferase
MKTPVLYHIEISHYNEKVRWTLDYKHVPHLRKAPPPMLHMLWALAMTGKPTFPVLVIDGRRISDSTRIIEELERRYPEPPLYPADAEQRRRALELEDFFDEELGPHIRAYLFQEAVEGLEPDEFIGAALGSTPMAVKKVMRATAPVGTRLLKARYSINPENAAAARRKTEAAFDRLDREIQPSGYLVGDGFTIADLTAAALFFPLVRPPEAPHVFDARFPEPIVRFREEMSKRPGFAWVQEMYRRHRGVSAAVAEPARAAA